MPDWPPLRPVLEVAVECFPSKSWPVRKKDMSEKVSYVLSSNLPIFKEIHGSAVMFTGRKKGSNVIHAQGSSMRRNQEDGSNYHPCSTPRRNGEVEDDETLSGTGKTTITAPKHRMVLPVRSTRIYDASHGVRFDF